MRRLIDATRPEGLPWAPPAEGCPPEMIAEAAAALASWRGVLAPSSPEARIRWLTKLGALVAGSASAETAVQRVKEFGANLQGFSAICFTEEARLDAARRFKWWPSFAELGEFFDEIERPMREERRRLQAIADAAAKMPDDWGTPEFIARRQAMGDNLALLARALKGDNEARAAIKMPLIEHPPAMTEGDLGVPMAAEIAPP